MLDLDDARRRFGWALTDEDRARLPYYDALTRALADDETGLTLLAEVRVEQRNPMLILASLHLLALEGDPILAPLYDAVRDGDGGDPGAWAARVLAVARSEPDAVRAHLHRATQTNEPGRSAILQFAIPLAATGAREVNVVELGTSAGINLHFDRFPVAPVDGDDPLTLVCEDRGPVDRSTPLPRVAARVGVDLEPLDLNRRDDQLWLLACLWPEEPRRAARLRAIIERRPTWPAVTILAGDALARLDDALALTTPGVPTVVIDTWFAPYLEEDAQREMHRRLAGLCASGAVSWVSVELPVAVRWPEPAHRTEAPNTGATEVVVTRAHGEPEHVGWCHHHGRWLLVDGPLGGGQTAQ
ncbi:MAG TPA: DUF2332 domain-containing protein [Acidimicrobiales bacterium]|nr:DUF2332 domain-containing protein [Acidimicrobiales bacterium]